MKRAIAFTFCIAALLIGAMFNSCSKAEKNYTIKEINGIKVFKNKNKPSVKNVDFNPKELFVIDGQEGQNGDSLSTFPSAASMAVDSKGNIYVLDFFTSSVKKFDNSGKFIKSFGRKGQGPGEIVACESMTINNDTVAVNDFAAAKIVLFDCDGKFVRNIPVPANARHKNLTPVGDDNYLVNLMKFIQENEEGYLIHDLALLDKKFKQVKNFRNFKVKYGSSDYSRLDFYDPFVVKGDKIFIAENSEDKYRVNVFDFKGKNLYSIEKSFRKIKFLDKEKTAFDSLYKLNGRRTPPLTVPFKKAINYIYHDNKDRLFVASSVERGDKNMTDLYLDVFKEGVFLKQLKLDLFASSDFMNFENRMMFKDGRIYLLNASSASVKVFEY